MRMTETSGWMELSQGTGTTGHTININKQQKNEPLEINREQVLKLVTQGCNFAHEQRKKKKKTSYIILSFVIFYCLFSITFNMTV